MIKITQFPPKYKVLNRGQWHYAHEICIYPDGSSCVTSLQGESGIDNDHTKAIVPFTGILDNSIEKLEIYLGDVIESTDSQGFKIRHVIVWDTPNARFGTLSIINQRPELNPPGQLTQEWINTCNKKVIGNAYEFTELLNPL